MVIDMQAQMRAVAAATLAARSGASAVYAASVACKAALQGIDLSRLTPEEGAVLARVSYAAWTRAGGDGTARGWCWVWLSYINNPTWSDVA